MSNPRPIQISKESDELFSVSMQSFVKYRVRSFQDGNLQGNHTIAYSFIVRSIENKLLNTNAIESGEYFWKIFDFLQYLYHMIKTTKILGRNDHSFSFYLRELFESTGRAVHALNRIAYAHDWEGNDSKLIEYFLNQLIALLQQVPFGSTIGKPNGARGEGSAIQYMRKNAYGTEENTLKHFSKVFDEDSIRQQMQENPKYQVEIVAVQIMGLLMGLEGFSAFKDTFFPEMSFPNRDRITQVIFNYSLGGRWQYPMIPTSERNLIGEAIVKIAKMQKEPSTHRYWKNM